VKGTNFSVPSYPRKQFVQVCDNEVQLYLISCSYAPKNPLPIEDQLHLNKIAMP